MDVEKLQKRLQDGMMAGGACFVASSAEAQEQFHQAAQNVSTQSGMADTSHPLITQILLPVITGLIVPFVKEWLLEFKEKRRERKKKRKEAADTKE